MMKVFICGDSFACSDADSTVTPWHELLNKTVQVHNLSLTCASNVLISLQVDAAITQGADYIICFGTSVVRHDVKLTSSNPTTTLLDRFYDFTRVLDNSNRDLISYSIMSQHNAPFTTAQHQILKQYQTSFVDLDISIYTNKCVIENTLQKLVDSRIPFIFDQGGFEHKSFSDSTVEYFTRYRSYISDINIWDYAQTRLLRPYFHITNQEIHKTIAEYYASKINKV